MNRPERDPQSGYDLHFEPPPGSKSATAGKGVDLYVQNRLAVEKLGRACFSGKAKRGTRDELIDALVAYDEVRAGELWNREAAGRLRDRYAKALGGKGGRIDLGRVRDGSGAVPLLRIPLPERFGQPFSPYNEPMKFEMLDLETQGFGWYYEKWFNYTGQAYVGYIQASPDTQTRRVGLTVHASNAHPGTEDGLRVTAEAGFWFTYVPPIDGYVECLFFMETEWYQSFRDAFPGPDDGVLASHQCLQGVAGMRRGNDFFGRSYANGKDSFYGGNGFSGIPDRNDTARLNMGFWLQSTYPVKAGKPVDVLFGMRAKIVASMDRVGLNFWEQWRGSPSAVAVRTMPEASG